MDYENVPDTSARSKYLKDCLFVSFQLGVSTRSTIVHHRPPSWAVSETGEGFCSKTNRSNQLCGVSFHLLAVIWKYFLNIWVFLLFNKDDFVFVYLISAHRKKTLQTSCSELWTSVYSSSYSQHFPATGSSWVHLHFICNVKFIIWIVYEQKLEIITITIGKTATNST